MWGKKWEKSSTFFFTRLDHAHKEGTSLKRGRIAKKIDAVKIKTEGERESEESKKEREREKIEMETKIEIKCSSFKNKSTRNRNTEILLCFKQSVTKKGKHECLELLTDAWHLEIQKYVRFYKNASEILMFAWQ